MNNSTLQNKDQYLNLNNIASLISFSLIVAVIFACLRYHFYYYVLLHIPIFQFLDTSELVLMTASTGIIWTFYLGSLALEEFIRKSPEFKKIQKIIFGLFILGSGLFYLWMNFRNDAIVRVFITLPLKYWKIFCPLLILFLIAYFFQGGEKPIFFKNNKLILPLIITIWYALWEGWSNFEAITNSKYTINNVSIKTKSLGSFTTDSIVVNAGRTKNYWFFYNRNTHLTKVIKNDDIEYVEFSADNK